MIFGKDRGLIAGSAPRLNRESSECVTPLDCCRSGPSALKPQASVMVGQAGQVNVDCAVVNGPGR